MVNECPPPGCRVTATVPVGSTGSTSSKSRAHPVALQALPDGPAVGVVPHPGHRQGLPAEGGQVGGDVQRRPGHHPPVGELVDEGLAEEQGAPARHRGSPGDGQLSGACGSPATGGPAYPRRPRSRGQGEPSTTQPPSPAERANSAQAPRATTPSGERST